MARLSRVIAVDVPHHVTQRGNARRDVFDSDGDRLVYLDLLRHYSRLHDLALAGYCLMSNHVHLIAIPRRPDSLPLAMKYTHGRYAAYRNTRHASSGHLWQGRYYSCPLDEGHFWTALRYVERNPVRAGLASTPEEYAWSSAAAHCDRDGDDRLLDRSLWRETWTTAAWAAYVAEADHDADDEIRRATHTGRPVGAAGFIDRLERTLGRQLAPLPGGRPRKPRPSDSQDLLAF